MKSGLLAKVKALKPQVILLSTALHTFASYKRIRRIVNHNVKNVVLNLDATIGLHFLTKRGLSFWKIRHTTQDFESRVRWYVVGYRARDGRYQAGVHTFNEKVFKSVFSNADSPPSKLLLVDITQGISFSVISYTKAWLKLYDYNKWFHCAFS